MQGMFRRQSGIYFARLAVPARLRPLVGKVELIQTTGSRSASLAKAIAADLLAGWRRALYCLANGTDMDILQLTTGSPRLQLPGYLPLPDAAVAAGMEPADLLRAAAGRAISLFLDPGFRPGFIVPLAELERDGPDGGHEIPSPQLMPPSAMPVEYPGTVQLYPEDVTALCQKLIAGGECDLRGLLPLGRPDLVYCPSGGAMVGQRNLLVRSDEVETLRAKLAMGVTQDQLRAARAARTASASVARATSSKSPRRVSEPIDAYLDERRRTCSDDQARRIRAACELFAELLDNPVLETVTRDLLRHYRDKLLPTVPANENKIRLRHGTTSIRESMQQVQGSGWPTISAGEIAKRMQWVCSLFEWLHDEKWITDDPAVGLTKAVRPRKHTAANRAREQFTRTELAQIFSAPWFQSGRGELTRRGTYREFLPYYFWLPLLGLYHGARINEICQLQLSDIRQTPAGTWYVDISHEGDDEGTRKRVKNANSVRRVPLHPHLIELGLLQWRDRLAEEGHARLFPELIYNARKGYSAAAVKWFSSYLARLGWPRTGTKVFHSFRHTVATECLSVLGLSEQNTAQITGHARGSTVLTGTYLKDAEIDKLATWVARLDFGLGGLAKFDIDEGIRALGDAMRRKREQPDAD